MICQARIRERQLPVSASTDETTHLWNLHVNAPVGPPLLLEHENSMDFAALSPDGKMLLVVTILTCGMLLLLQTLVMHA